MTQLELPPISFARYLDLLKRRRWQVLPVTIAGLLVGAVVAFFIPRYYVCQTSVMFRGQVLGVAAGGVRDPMAALVDSAEIAILYSVGETLETLAWPEVTAADPESRRAFETDVRSRVQVHDIGRGEEGRTSTNLRIVYRDTDPYRAEEFTNALREVWIAGERRAVLEAADRELTAVTKEIALAQQVSDNADLELAEVAKQHSLNPMDLLGPRDGVLEARSKELGEVVARIAEGEGRRDGLAAQIEARKEQRAETPTKVKERQQPVIPLLIQKKIDAAQLELAYAMAALLYMKESHKDHAFWTQTQKAKQTEIAELLKALGPVQEVEIDNPAYVRLTAEIDDKTMELEGLDGELSRLRSRRAQLEAEIRDLPDILASYRQFDQARGKAQDDLDALLARRREKAAHKRLLAETEPFEVKERANAPPRPTDPNIALVALAGSAVGLAFAIGLVLLIDFLQTTFKTPDDVARVLALPVLGGMSHLLTAERRREAQSRRTRAGLVAGVFLVLMVSLITVYYVAPTRLPPVVRDTLDLLLGSTSPASAPK